MFNSALSRAAAKAPTGLFQQTSLNAQTRMYMGAAGRYRNSRCGKKALILGLAVAGGAYYYYNRKNEKNRVACEGIEPNIKSPEKALSLMGWTTLTLRETQDMGENAKLFRFNLPKEDQVSGHTTSSFIMTSVVKPGTEKNWWPTYFYRPYTPVSAEGDVGHIDIVVKKYKDGNSSKSIHSLKPGDKLDVMGPLKTFKYQENSYKSIGMIAAGSGITPMFQLLHKILDNSEDKTKVNLLYCNRTEDDILLRKELENMAAKNPERLQITYCLTQPPLNWEQESGRVSLDMVKKHMPEPSSATKIFVCGPEGMVSTLTSCGCWWFFKRKDGILEELGYDGKSVCSL
ncbi:hypothetical protein K450DRAFT_225703 [Umbelopsis ramanniana AG]|uniref:NADH-cytochrome b5 reductase n=1 Tax=Umbelopsis ramanniana AG TaxID=1314678 RepID=A0AAD5EGK6_UMBRA|nr:uncharacterized protein K450DRAFT_225703 [Umbelopsis ramanniana AG]KAI8582972.1 hypothetical protein K450DRAFT_225703 [Umbelopsis ramanniana AG]